jgi:hypothetical protein
MKNRYYQILIILLIPFISPLAQNSNLLMQYFSGGYNSMGRTGLAATNSNSSFDLNPAVLTNYSSVNISLASNFKCYNYTLVRISSQVGGTTWNWNNSKLAFEQASFIYPINQKLGIGIGIFQKLDPQFVNKKRAITFSDLFLQETQGNLYSAALSLGYKINDEISIGVSVYNYFGNINSRVTGDNHGNDLDKWVYLESELSGINFRSGILLKKETWSIGLVIETPFKMDVNTTNDISSEGYFESLLPAYTQTYLNMPWIIGAGFSFKGYKNWLFEIDMETRQYKQSDVRFNLYEFGGLPVWESVNIFRAGIQYLIDSRLMIPFRAGYAYIPQLYYSNNSVGISNNITSYTNTDRNVKHVFTIGSSARFSYLTLNLNLEYSVVEWHRTLMVPFTISDEYNEKDFILSIELLVRLGAFL